MSSNTVVISGMINPDGTNQYGSGYTSSKSGTGSYRLDFAAGTFPSGAVPVAMPISASFIYGSKSESQNDGSGYWQVNFGDASGKAVDTLFNFIVASG